jgi:small ligand-binding sensory domain FIST
MNKTILLPLALSSLGVALLAGCTPASTASTPTSLEQEVVSSALLSQKNTASPLLLKKATASSAADLSFDATDVPGTLASFDALSLDNYTIKTNVLVSDKEDYDHKDEIVYTLADGSSKSVILYYSESKLVSTSATVSASATVNASTSDGKRNHRYGTSGTPPLWLSAWRLRWDAPGWLVLPSGRHHEPQL